MPHVSKVGTCRLFLVVAEVKVFCWIGRSRVVYTCVRVAGISIQINYMQKAIIFGAPTKVDMPEP